MKRNNLEKMLYLFLLISPLLDIMSGVFKEIGFTYTPTTFLRPIIPFIILIYIWFKDSNIRFKLSLAMLSYIVYGIIHLFIYNGLVTGFSYGNVLHELQYIVNYTYLVFTLFVFVYLFYKKNTKLENITFYTLLFYVATIYLAIITGTSFNSYENAIGFKGWFYVSGGIGSIILFSLFVISSNLNKIKTKYSYKILLVILSLFYLMFLIGSRVGLIGSIYFILVYILATAYNYFIGKKKLDLKRYYKIIIPVVITFVIFGILFGSATLRRRKEIDDMSSTTNNIANELVDIKKAVDNNTVSNDYISDSQIKALNDLYNYAKVNKMKDTDFRGQQLMYHTYLYINDSNILHKLFGNGFLTNYGSLTLEMEIIALLYNFGLIGLILYFGPFLAIFIYSLTKSLTNKKKIDSGHLILFGGVLISYLVSILAGHIYFNTSVMPVVIILHVLLLNKAMEEKV